MTEATNAANKAIEYMLWRVRADPRLAYHMLHTEALRRLVTAHADAHGQDPEQILREFNTCPTEGAAMPRSGRCAAEIENICAPLMIEVSPTMLDRLAAGESVDLADGSLLVPTVPMFATSEVEHG